MPPTDTDNEYVSKKPVWNSSVKDNFTTCFNEEIMLGLTKELDDTFANKSYSVDCINNLTEKLSNFVVTIAEKCDLIVNKSNIRHKQDNAKKAVNKSWFDFDCSCIHAIFNKILHACI